MPLDRTLAFTLLISLACPMAYAQDLSANEIVQRLQRQAVASGGRGLRLRQDDMQAAMQVSASDRVDIQIVFDVDSSDLRSDQVSKLAELCSAMRSLPSLDFLLIGHTDATGEAGYNQSLSEKRAVSVGLYLIDSCDISNERLSSIGRGEAQLLDTQNPKAEINRRVEVQARQTS